MNLDKRLVRAIISVVLAVMTWLALIFLANLAAPVPAAQRVLILFGGSTSGYIQFFCYIAFFYGLFEIIQTKNEVKKELQGFDLNILPTKDQLVLSPEEVAKIKLSVLEMEKRGLGSKITDFIKKACTQYRNDQSVSETLHVIDMQIETDKEEFEGGLSMVRYLIGAIMSLGFIGTLIGLTNAIGNAHLAKTEEGLPILTSYLNIAFDTTMVALVLGLILNFFYHDLIANIDKFYARSKSYIVDNLISRIFVS